MDILELTKLITLFDTQYIVLLKKWIDSWLRDNNLCLFHCANAHKKGEKSACLCLQGIIVSFKLLC